MHLLVDELSLTVSPSLAVRIGLNEALFLQNLHFRLRISKNVRDGHKWVYNTYEQWGKQFPFWSLTTVQRVIRKLEKEDYLISASGCNRMKIDRTKWYRVNYEHCDFSSIQQEQKMQPIYEEASVQHDVLDENILTEPITELVPTQFPSKESVETPLNTVISVINYLNNVSKKQFKATTATTRKIILDRLEEGFTLDDFQRVINTKSAQWLDDEKFSMYLRPSTLFSTQHFENYLNESPATSEHTEIEPFELDFTRGEVKWEDAL